VDLPGGLGVEPGPAIGQLVARDAGERGISLPFSHTVMWASYYCAQEAFPHLRKAGERGRLLLITHLSIYSPLVKAAQRALLKSLAREWGPYGITVNCLAAVALTPELLANFESTPSLKGRVESGIPLGRIGDPERDIGRVASFLVSDLTPCRGSSSPPS
jgi:3-oxoacyl-[acyl-carrier protein] reductase